MDQYNTMKHNHNGYGYDNRNFENQNQIYRQMPPAPASNRGAFTGWGCSNFQLQQENNYKSFSAQNLQSAKKFDQQDHRQEEDFERSVPVESEHEYSHFKENYAPSCAQSNYGDVEKSIHGSAHNTYMMNDDHWSAISGHESQNPRMDHSSANLMSLAKPTVTMASKPKTATTIGEYQVITSDDHQRKLSLKMLDVERNTLNLELTEEDNPQFLYTCEIGKNEFESIRQKQQIRIEFHKLANHLAELIKLCIDRFKNQNQRTVYQCLFQQKDSANTAEFKMQERNEFKDNCLIVLNFIKASDQEKLNFLSSQVKNYKKQTAMLVDQRDSKTKEFEGISLEFQHMVSLPTLNM